MFTPQEIIPQDEQIFTPKELIRLNDHTNSLLKPKKLQLKKVINYPRSQTVSIDQTRPIGDGRKIGFNNQNMMPILPRERNTQLNGLARARREASIDGYREKLKLSMQYKHHYSMN